jgi:hypothetical protein
MEKQWQWVEWKSNELEEGGEKNVSKLDRLILTNNDIKNLLFEKLKSVYDNFIKSCYVPKGYDRVHY